MAKRQAAKIASQEQYFFEYVEQLDRHRAGRMALIVTLSGIDTARALQATQNLVSDHIRRHMGNHEYQLFHFQRGDVAVLTKDVGDGFVRDMAFGLIYQLKDEAFFQTFEDGESDLCRLLEVEADYKALRTYAKAGLHRGAVPLAGDPMETVAQDDGQEAEQVESPEDADPEDQDTDSLVVASVNVDYNSVGSFTEIDTTAELETVRDEVIELPATSGSGIGPKIAMSHFAADEAALTERFLRNADEETYAAYLPGILQEAEQRLLDRLSNDDPQLLPEKLMISVQVQTLLSASFLSFDRMRAEMSVLPRAFLVVDRNDVRTNGEAFKFARDFVEGRGHVLAISGLNFDALGKVRLKNSGFAYQFVKWNAIDASLVTAKDIERLRAGVQDKRSAITVLTGCDEEEAIAFGQRAGIELFEGRAATGVLIHAD